MPSCWIGTTIIIAIAAYLGARRAHYGIEIEYAHDAVDDAVASAKVLLALSAGFPGLGVSLIPMHFMKPGRPVP
jgi:hypothetical protein